MSTDSDTEETTRPHILTLDGGGVRGLSSLIILRDLMKRVERRRGRPVRPCECFDLIVGTGTGAISALFLGRLGMTVDEAISAYVKVAEKSFEPSYPWTYSVIRRQIRLDGSTLEKEVAEVVASIAGKCDERLQNTSDGTSSCRTAIVAATSAYMDSPPHLFRSYDNTGRWAICTIGQVARASSATAGLFLPVELGDPPIKFMDAGDAGYNNPTDIGLDEAATIWPESPVGCVVSLGTGLQRIVSVGEEWSEVIDACRKTLASCERVDNYIVLRGKRDKFPYFRFNVDRGLPAVDITEWRDSGARGQLVAITEGYTRWARVGEDLNKCAQILSGDNPESPEFSRPTISRRVSAIPGNSLPGVPPVFHGRHDHVSKAVTAFVGDDSARLALLGAAGIGKTSIATKILHESTIQEKFKQQRCFIPCEGIHFVSLLIDSMCSVFGVSPRPVERHLDSLQDASDRRTTLLTFMRQKYTSQPVLLVLDNFETLWDGKGQTEVEKFLEDIGGVQMLSLLLTMRGMEYPGGLHWSSPRLPAVLPLDPDSARAAFMEICGRSEVEGPELDSLLRELDYVPLAVTLMARLAQQESPIELSRRWKDERSAILSRPRHKDRLTNVDYSIRVSLEGHRMQSTPEALLLLSSISILPLGVSDDSLALICPRISNLAEASQTLREVALAYQDSAKNLRVLSPIRLHIMKHYPPASQHAEDIESFHFKLAKETLASEHSYEEATDIVTKAGQNIEAVIIQAFSRGRGDDAVQAALDWTLFLQRTYPRATVIEAAVQFVRGRRNRKKLFECLYSLGETHRLSHDYEAAQKALTEARDECKVPEDPPNVATVQCLWSLGELLRMGNKFEEAEEALKKARDGYQSLGKESDVANCLWGLGEIWRQGGRYDNAEQALIESRDRYQSLKNSRGVAQCLCSFGELWRTQGKYDKAEQSFDEAQKLYTSLGDTVGRAECLWCLGEARRKKGDYDAAEEALSRARSFYETCRNLTGSINCLWSLGEVWRKMGKYDTAHENLSKAREQYGSLGDTLGETNCMWSLGEVSRLRGIYDDAERVLTQARHMYQFLDSPRGEANCLLSLGDVWRLKGQYDQAEQTITEARELYEWLGDPFGVPDCQWSLGEVWRLRDNHDEAEKKLTEARDQYRTLGTWPGLVQCLLSLGKIRYTKGRYAEAEKALTEARYQYKSFRGPYGMAECLWYLGEVFRLRGKYQDAISVLTEARDGYETLHDPFGVANCGWSLGEIRRKEGKYDEAEDELTAARHQYAPHSLLGVANCLWSIGEVRWLRGQDVEAENALVEAQQRYEFLHNPLGVANCFWTLGEMKRQQGEYAEAERRLSEAQDQYAALDVPLGLANCFWGLGEIRRRLGKYEEAEAMLTQAQERYKSLGDCLGETNCLWSLSEVQRKLGKLDGAETGIVIAQAGYKSIGDLLGETNCMWSLAEICRMRRKYDDAEEILGRARDTYTSISHHFGVTNCDLTLEEVRRMRAVWSETGLHTPG